MKPLTGRTWTLSRMCSAWIPNYNAFSQSSRLQRKFGNGFGRNLEKSSAIESTLLFVAQPISQQSTRAIKRSSVGISLPIWRSSEPGTHLDEITMIFSLCSINLTLRNVAKTPIIDIRKDPLLYCNDEELQDIHRVLSDRHPDETLS